MRTRQLTGTLFFILITVSVAMAQAQDVPRFEVGAQFSALAIRETDSLPALPDPANRELRTEAGVGGRFTYNVTAAIALEAEVNFFPHDSGSSNEYTDGHVAQGLFGVKLGKRFNRFGVFGKVRPGFVRFSRAVNGSRPETSLSSPNEPFFALAFDGRTDFAIDVGGVLEFYPSRRIVTRFDVGDTIIRYQEQTFESGPLTPITPPFIPITMGTLPGRTTHNFQFSAGIGIRLGGPASSSPSPSAPTGTGSDVPRFEVGAHFSSITVVQPERFSNPPFSNNTFRTEMGVGGRLTYNLTDSVAVEAEATFFPSDNVSSTTEYTAGRITQGLFGVKLGKRFNRFGVFGKVRPGFVRFSQALRGSKQVSSPTGLAFEFDGGGRTNFAADVGGVLEFYPSSRFLTRFDFSDTIIHYKKLSFELGQPITSVFTITVPQRTEHNFQFSAGVGMRF